MKTMVRFTAVMITVLFSVQSVGAERMVIKITNGEWPPFLSERAPHHGLVSHIVTEAFKLEDVTVEYGFFPWKRAYVTAQDDDWDASVAWYWTEERNQSFLFSDPVFIEQQMVFYLKNKPFEWNTIADLQGKQIGATIGYFYGDPFQKAEERGMLQVQRVATDEQNVKKLLAGRVDVVVMSLQVGTYLLRTQFSSEEMVQIAYHPQPVNKDALYVIFPKSHPKSQEWVTIFNRGLGKLKSSGQVDRFFQEALDGKYYE
ncbi:MAG: substrate-binding periplasmic protein [Thermodesulfobacteriota bacterium]